MNNIDNIDNIFYDTLCKINKLFKQKKFKSNIGAKASEDSINQTIVYYNPINITEQYELQIHSKNSITIMVPLQNCNHYYKTTHDTLYNIYEFIKIHI